MVSLRSLLNPGAGNTSVECHPNVNAHARHLPLRFWFLLLLMSYIPGGIGVRSIGIVG